MRARLRFEGRARSQHPTLTARATGRGHNAEIVYRLMIDVPEYEPRKVVIRLRNGFEPYGEHITADGQTDSPHRYGSDRLCIWHPDDSPEHVWTADDGLGELISHAAIHLFKEAYWRETGEWLGPEASHGQAEGKQSAAG
ncbi:MAG: hypothetical protein ACRDLN_01515 [Solirubrobacteraceae bacterium]